MMRGFKAGEVAVVVERAAAWQHGRVDVDGKEQRVVQPLIPFNCLIDV